METGGVRFGSHLRRFIVDVSIGAATLAVAFATISMTANFLYLLLIPCALALICFGLVLEPKATPGADIGAQPLRYSTRLATLNETQPYVIG